MILPEKIGEVNVSGPEQGILKIFTQALKSESQLRLLAEVCAEAVFWIDEVCYRYNVFDGQMTRQDALDTM